MPIATCRLLIKQKTLRQLELRGKNALNCEQSKIRSQRMSDVKTLIDILTGHCLVGTHAETVGRSFYDYCRSGQQPEQEENIEHLLCHCPAYNRTRNDLLQTTFLVTYPILWLLINVCCFQNGFATPYGIAIHLI